jgi:hypothetical protein
VARSTRTLGLMDSDAMRQLIQRNADELSRLHSRISQTEKLRSHGSAEKQEWELACAEFHARFDDLAFPGGFKGALARIEAGDPDAMEAAICFLEVRPYFVRSGYMFKDILKKAKRAPLSEHQAIRLASIMRRLAERRASKGRHEA